MSPALDEQIQQLKSTITEMEAQRPTLGDEVVDAALAPLQRKLDELVGSLRAQETRQVSLPAEPAQQRKLVTLLFMDIAGSTAIAQHMDPEDVREVFDMALKKLAEPVEAHGGRVTRFMGDGFLSGFGAPLAREDDPEQAVRAGLAIIGTAQELALELEAQWDIPDFQVRVGINTGLVALGGQTEAQDTLMGAAVNLAARLESAASPGGLLISHNTYRHVRGLFDVEPWDPIQVKGFDEPVRVYRVLRLKPRAFRTYTRGVEEVETTLVGREAELKYLQDALLTANEESEGQVVTITGEAGVGKSRLLYEFQDWIELLPPPAVRFFEGRGRYEAQGQPYGLLRDIFEFRFQIQDDDSADAARRKLTGGLMEVFGPGTDGMLRAHILGQLLGFDFSASPHLREILGDPRQLRDRGLMYLSEYFGGLCATGPVVVFLEDIHWADDSSLGALSWLGERLQQKRLLVVCAARPTLFERRPYWGEGLGYHHCLELEPLSRRESRQLVGEIFKLADQLPNEMRELVVEGAEGNPFYLEELVKMLVEDGVVTKGDEIWTIHPERMAEIEVPPTLAGVLQARLDSLPPREREVLQQASVVGRQFWDRVVAHIQAAGDSSPQLVPETLTALRGRELVYRREESAFAGAHEYIFKHDILREVTYESVLKRLRRVYHGLVAEWLIAQGSERTGEYRGLIAGHLLQANRNEQAAEYFLQAGEAALASYANKEAEAYFHKALGFSSDKSQHAACLAGLGEAQGRQGHSGEASLNLRRAIDIYRKTGDYERVPPLYIRLSAFLFHDNHQKAWDACQEGMALLEGTLEEYLMVGLLAEAGRVANFIAKDAEKAPVLLNRAVELAERAGNLEVVADAKITLALLETNLLRAKTILLEVVELAEANRLLNIANRAHHNLGYILESLLDPSAYVYHTKRAIEVGKQISVNYIYSTSNLIEGYIQLGELDAAANILTEEIQQINAPLQEKEFITLRDRGRILCARGEWKIALMEIQRCLDMLHEVGGLYLVENRKVQLAMTILELDRFEVKGHLFEAEKALRENLEIGDKTLLTSFCLLSIVLARQGQFPEAYDWLTRAGDGIEKQYDNQEANIQARAEFELAFAQEQWGAATSLCEKSIGILKNHGLRWEWARRLVDLGDALLGRDEPGDQERAMAAYQQSLEMFTEMDAPGYAKVLEGRLTTIDAAI